MLLNLFDQTPLHNPCAYLLPPELSQPADLRSIALNCAIPVVQYKLASRCEVNNTTIV